MEETVTATTHDVQGERAHLSLAPALDKLARAGGARSVLLFAHGSLEVELYVPRDAAGRRRDPQSPHTRDELYVVARGGGVFFNGVSRLPVAPGDLLFAPAGSEHRFEQFTDEFAVWVMFYGPEGGEPGNPSSS
jgi:mannose-6-phosphate isomerase-like protein (cupin superfamily)